MKSTYNDAVDNTSMTVIGGTSHINIMISRPGEFPLAIALREDSLNDLIEDLQIRVRLITKNDC